MLRSLAAGQRQRAWIVTWHVVEGTYHAKPGSGHFSHLAKETAMPRPCLHYTCFYMYRFPYWFSTWPTDLHNSAVTMTILFMTQLQICSGMTINIYLAWMPLPARWWLVVALISKI